MIEFIDEYRVRFGVEVICRVLRAAVSGFITSRGYRYAKSRPPSARALSDSVLIPEIIAVHKDNFSVYGVRKMQAAMRNAGWVIGREQTARLMKQAGVRGIHRGKKVFTTRSDSKDLLPADLVKRDFKATRPRQLWVADITYVRTWQGFAYTAFIIDAYSRRIVGWNVASTLKSEVLPLQALEMAAWQAKRESHDITGVIHHSDHGSNYLSMVYTGRISELGAIPSTGTVGDSYDNALAEAVNGLYKAELIRRRGSWKTVEQVELATLEWVWWWNNQRLHSALNMQTPTQAETTFYASQHSPQPALAGAVKT